MKKTIIMMLMALATLSTTVSAQNEQRREQRRMDPAEMAQRMTDRMAKEYGLNEEQTEKLLKLNMERVSKMTPGMGRFHGEGDRQQRPSREEMEKRMQEAKAEREAYDAQLKEIFTEEQFAKYQENAKKRNSRMGRGPRHGGPHNRR